MSHIHQISLDPSSYVTTQALRTAGLSRRQIEQCVQNGVLVRVRRGRYLDPGTDPDTVQAARLGGRLDCISLLTHRGVFVCERAGLHIQVDVGASRLPHRESGVTCHWRVSRAGREQLCGDLIEALAQSCLCQEPRAAIATLDSAWHLGLIDEAGIAEVFDRLPLRFRALRPLLERRSESGTETIVRLILRTLGCRFDVQVQIDTVGRVDFLVDGWLIIECDSEAHHAAWTVHKRDRRRDLAAARLGYTTIRLLAEDILYHRELVQAALTDIIAERRRLVPVRNSSKRRAASTAPRR